MSWITENICNFFTDMMSAVIEQYGSLVNNMFFTFVALASENEYYQNAQRFFCFLGFALIGLMAAKIILSGYVMETAYDAEEDPFNLLIRIAEGTAVASCSGWIFRYGLQISRDFFDDLLGSTQLTGYDGKTRELLQVDFSINTSYPAFVVMLVAIFIAFLIFTVVSGLRAGELLVMNLFLPIFAVDLLTNSRERWNNFFIGYVFALISYAIQAFFFMLAMKSYLSASYTDQTYLLSAFIFMVVAIRAPKFIEKYLYTSGVSNAASSGIRMVVQTAVMRASMGGA